MHIIFKKNSEEIAKKYIVLDLDTFGVPDGSTHTVCCVVENIPITELAEAETLKTLHNSLIQSYAQQDWSSCEEAIKQLTGKWGGEVDSFYQDLQTRINRLKTLNLTQDWSPVIPKV
jgi:hypothetical protein